MVRDHLRRIGSSVYAFMRTIRSSIYAFMRTISSDLILVCSKFNGWFWMWDMKGQA